MQSWQYAPDRPWSATQVEFSRGSYAELRVTPPAHVSYSQDFGSLDKDELIQYPGFVGRVACVRPKAVALVPSGRQPQSGPEEILSFPWNDERS